MDPLLVVEDERLLAARAEPEASPGNGDVTLRRRGRRRRSRGTGFDRARIGVRLPRIGEGFVVHVLVEGGQEEEVETAIRWFATRDLREHRVTDLLQIREGLLSRRQ